MCVQVSTAGLTEAEIARREAACDERERKLRAASLGLLVPNWPPCRPIVHHDIKNDIPDGKKGMARW
jgi:hypothetical protein